MHLLTWDRLAILNRLIRYSLLSLYSRLENIQPPEKKIPIKKWTDDEWKTHRKYLKKLSKPKKPPKPPKLEKFEMSYENMKRYKTLAISRQRPEFVKEDWQLLAGVKAYAPSLRILELARPNIREDAHNIERKIDSMALKYKASPRIKELAAARERNIGEADLKENPFAISPNALKAKPSQRTQELAEPKEFENAHIRENPFAISPAALKAKASPRIIELAKPKEH